MKKLLALAFLVSMLGCASKPASTAESSAPATESAPATADSDMKDCSCTAAPTEACHPNCDPITWKSKDCDSANGRPRACAEPATH